VPGSVRQSQQDVNHCPGERLARIFELPDHDISLDDTSGEKVYKEAGGKT